MKRFLNGIITFLFILVLVPTFVYAEDNDEEKEEVTKEPIKIYEFYGDTCPHCAASFEFFESIEEEYGDYFDLVKFEVYRDEANDALLNEIIKAYNDTDASGVPYIVIGDYTLNGYSQEYDQEIIKAIVDEYNKDVRSTKAKDVIDNFKFEKDELNVVVFGIIVAVVAAGIVVLVIKARQED